jgi:hypothetical protein
VIERTACCAARQRRDCDQRYGCCQLPAPSRERETSTAGWAPPSQQQAYGTINNFNGLDLIYPSGHWSPSYQIALAFPVATIFNFLLFEYPDLLVHNDSFLFLEQKKNLINFICVLSMIFQFAGSKFYFSLFFT